MDKSINKDSLSSLDSKKTSLDTKEDKLHKLKAEAKSKDEEIIQIKIGYRIFNLNLEKFSQEGKYAVKDFFSKSLDLESLLTLCIDQVRNNALLKLEVSKLSLELEEIQELATKALKQ